MFKKIFVIMLFILISSIFVVVEKGGCFSSPCNASIDNSFHLGYEVDEQYDDIYINIDLSEMGIFVKPIYLPSIFIAKRIIPLFDNNIEFYKNNYGNWYLDNDREDKFFEREYLVDQHNFYFAYFTVVFLNLFILFLYYRIVNFLFRKIKFLDGLRKKKAFRYFMRFFLVLLFLYILVSFLVYQIADISTHSIFIWNT